MAWCVRIRGLRVVLAESRRPATVSFHRRAAPAGITTAAVSGLVTEYRRAAEGCAKFIKTHPDSPLARKRRQQALRSLVPGSRGSPCWDGRSSRAGLAVAMVMRREWGPMAREFAPSRTAESLAYPLAGGTLGVVFTLSVARGLLSGVGPRTTACPAWDAAATPRRGVCWPLLALLVLQACLSLSLVWSNTAFTDEAQYLWAGHLEIAHYLHGASLPVGHLAFQDYFSGVPRSIPFLELLRIR